MSRFSKPFHRFVVLPMVAAALIAPLWLAARGHAARQAPLTLEGGVGWINSAPIHMSDLRGKVVLLDFWTYCCINCHHVLPDLAKLEQKYKNELVVIGVHTAKFDAERETENIRKKVREYRIEHPVINDANQVLWSMYGVRSWPTLVLVDAQGGYVGQVSGEGQYAVLDREIGKLVAKHKARGELDETPLTFFPEKSKPDTGPLLFPGKVHADAPGNRLFIGDTGHNRVVVTDLAGKGLATIGSGVEGFADGPYDKAMFHRPQGTCLVGDTLYVADTENHAIRAVDLKAKQVKTVAGTGQQSLRQNGKGPGDKTRLNSPWDVLLLPGTNVLAIAMAGPHQIWKLDLKTGQVGVWAGSGTEDIIDGSLGDSAFAQPSGLATDGKYLFVADSEVSGIRTVSITPSGGRVGRLVGLGLFEFGDVDGIGPTVRLQHCLGVAYNEGSLYIADSYNNKIKVCDPKTRAVKTLVGTHRAGDADSPPQFDEPGGLSVGGKTLYVADTNNHAIRTVDLETNKVATLAISGIEPPPSSKRPPSFPNPVATTLPPAKVAPGSSVSIDVALALPEGFKLSPDAPLPYLVEATGGASVLAPEVSPEGSTVDPPSPKFTVKVPLAKARAAGDAIELKLSVASIICRSGATGVCMPKSYVWTVPIQFIDGGPERIEVATPTPPAPASR